MPPKSIQISYLQDNNSTSYYFFMTIPATGIGIFFIGKPTKMLDILSSDFSIKSDKKTRQSLGKKAIALLLLNNYLLGLVAT